MFTLAEENYLKAIYHLEKDGNTGVSTNSIAIKLNMQPSSVTDMVQKLALKKALSYQKYKKRLVLSFVVSLLFCLTTCVILHT